MTSQEEQQRVVLPDSLLACIAAIAVADMRAMDRLTGVLAMIWGWAWYERQGSVDPTAQALPTEQWAHIAGLLKDGPRDDPIDGVNLALSFMNSGPSAYER